jgi:hypothetical protein
MSPIPNISSELDSSRPPPLEPERSAKMIRLFRISQMACESLDNPRPFVEAASDDLVR